MKSIRVIPIFSAFALGITTSRSAVIVFNPSQTTANVLIDNATSRPDVAIDTIGTTDWKVWDYDTTTTTIGVQQKAGASVIGDLAEVHPTNAALTATGSVNGSTTGWIDYSWTSGGTPLVSSTGFLGGISSFSSNVAQRGYSLTLTLPDVAGTVTFWGITRETTNKLSVLDGNNVELGSTSYSQLASQWDLTEFSFDWSGATVGEQISLKFLQQGTGNNSRIGVAGIAVSAVPEPSSLALFGLGGLLVACRRR